MLSATWHYKRVRKSLRFRQRYFEGSFLLDIVVRIRVVLW